MTFKELVNEYEKHIPNVISLRAKFPKLETVAMQVLAEKAEKHASDFRKLAIYLAGYAEMIPVNKKMFKDLLLAIPTLGNAYKKKALEVNGDEFIQLVGYAHSDGTYHWFEVKRIV